VLSDRGAEALDLIAGRGFDLVLLDTRLPDMSGMHVLREIRGSRETADLPVIMLTDRENGAGAEALAAGADDYCVKPFDFECLSARVERTLARAGRIEELKRSNLALDARIAARAIELGEAWRACGNARRSQPACSLDPRAPRRTGPQPGGLN
jgi:DNA-binding response OmpR family regulator